MGLLLSNNEPQQWHRQVLFLSKHFDPKTQNLSPKIPHFNSFDKSHRLHLRPHAKYVYLNSLKTLKFMIANFTYDGCSISSRTVLLSKHTVTAENQNYYEVVLPLMYITYYGLIYDVTL